MRKRIILSLLTAIMISVTACGSAAKKEEAPAAAPEEEAVAEESSTSETAADETPAEEAPPEDALPEGTPAEAPENTGAEPAEETGETGVVVDEDIDALYAGTWAEEHAGRGNMEIMPSGDGKYYIEARWPGSATVIATWYFTAIYMPDTGDLSYDDGAYEVTTYDSDGNGEITEEGRVHGTIHAVDGKIEWTDSLAGEEPAVFIRE